MRAIVFAVLLLVGVPGCARHFTVSPEHARKLNHADWTVTREPGPGGADVKGPEAPESDP